MRRWFLAFLAVALFAIPAAACSFCAAGLQSRQTLREHLSQAPFVVHGQLKNPRYDAATDAGTTDLQIATVLKSPAALNGPKVLTVPRYLPVIGNTPPDYLLFGTLKDGTLDPTHGVPATPAVIDYLKHTARLDPQNPSKRLAFYFLNLDSPDETVASDAFTELARAPDTDILAAAKLFDAGKLRTLITNSATPVERLGVLAFMLGTCGGPADAAFLAGLVKQDPLTERASSAFGGLLAGYILLAPKDGWELARATLGDAKRPYAERLSVVGTVRFFQITRPRETKADVLRCCGTLLAHGDLADQAVEDLRRWGWWELTNDVLAQWGKPTHAAPIVRRAIVRYALSCPTPEAKAFLVTVRHTDAKLVETVADSLAVYEKIPPR